MSQPKSAFTPLRISLIISIILANLAAIAAYFAPINETSDMLGMFAVVFIMMFVFVQIMEMVWLHIYKKSAESETLKNSYQKAMLIYSVLFVFGFIMVYLVLTKS